jgi:hypothetical protein
LQFWEQECQKKEGSGEPGALALVLKVKAAPGKETTFKPLTTY